MFKHSSQNAHHLSKVKNVPLEASTMKKLRAIHFNFESSVQVMEKLLCFQRHMNVEECQTR